MINITKISKINNLVGGWGRIVTCIWMAESLHCFPEITTTLLTDYNPVQNGFGVKKNKNKF